MTHAHDLALQHLLTATNLLVPTGRDQDLIALIVADM